MTGRAYSPEALREVLERMKRRAYGLPEAPEPEPEAKPTPLPPPDAPLPPVPFHERVPGEDG